MGNVKFSMSVTGGREGSLTAPQGVRASRGAVRGQPLDVSLHRPHQPHSQGGGDLGEGEVSTVGASLPRVLPQTSPHARPPQ